MPRHLPPPRTAGGAARRGPRDRSASRLRRSHRRARGVRARRRLRIRIPGRKQVGPRVFPLFVGVILLRRRHRRRSSASLAGASALAKRAKTSTRTPRPIGHDRQDRRLSSLGATSADRAHRLGASSAALLFGGIAWALGAKRWWMALPRRVSSSAFIVQVLFGELLGLFLPPGPLFDVVAPACSYGGSHGQHQPPDGGLRHGDAAEYLVFAFLGVLVGTAVGVLPGIGPAMTVALLLPLTYSLDPTAAIIIFAGHLLRRHVRRLDDQHPAEHTRGIGIHHHRHRRQQDGASSGAAPLRSRPRPSGRSSPARSPPSLLTLFAPVIAQFARRPRPGRLRRADRRRVHHCRSPAGFVGVAGPRLARHRPVPRASSAPSCSPGQARYTLGLLPLADGIDVVLVAVGLFAVGETLYVASRLRHGPVPVIPVERRLAQLDEARRLEALVEAVAARDGDRLPDRHDTGRWSGCRHLPLVRHREEALEAQESSSAVEPSKVSRARSRPTTPPRPVCSCRC